MKRVSRRPNKQIQNSLINKDSKFSESQTISQEGHFVKPSSQTSFINEKLMIICKGYGKDAIELGDQVLKFLKVPMMVLLSEQCKLNKEPSQIMGNDLTEEQVQRYYILNLIDSCFQELSSQSYQGTCSFGLCYIVGSTLFIVKNKMIECYLIYQKQRDQYEFKTVGSKKLPFQLNAVSSHSLAQGASSKETTGFFNCDQSYENIISRKYFPQLSFSSLKIPKHESLIFLVGNSECFCHFQEEEVIRFFHNQKNLKEGGIELIYMSKKKWKTIYQQDMTLIVSRFS